MNIYGWLILSLIIIAAGIYHLGQSDARTKFNYSAAISSVKILREKGAINAQISHSSAVALCADYGLPDEDKSKCVRGVREASAKP